MPFCKDTVTYSFCPRQFDTKFINLQGDALIAKLDAHAKACHAESMLDDDEKLRRSSTEDHKKCVANVKKRCLLHCVSRMLQQPGQQCSSTAWHLH